MFLELKCRQHPTSNPKLHLYAEMDQTSIYRKSPYFQELHNAIKVKRANKYCNLCRSYQLICSVQPMSA